MFSPNSSSAAVDYCISQIANSDVKVAITALKELDEHFKNKGSSVWLKHLNQVGYTEISVSIGRYWWAYDSYCN